MSGDQPKHKGPQAVAEMLNLMDVESRERILQELIQRDPATAEKIKAHLFHFLHLRLLDPQSAQLLFRAVPTKKLALALRGIDEEFMDFVLQHMSRSAGEHLKEEMQAMGPQRKIDVETIQQELATKVKEMLLEQRDGQLYLDSQKLKQWK